MVGLVDCNNFYVSCERLFDLSLLGRPVIVLSNNDGCVISRSNEAKKIGFKMGDTLFESLKLIDKYNVAVYSSNYALYGDLSNRVMTMLGGFVEESEIYSIDESFLSFKGFQNYNLYDYGNKIVKNVSRGTGIPVSLGIAGTKTLAKIANKFAKKHPGYRGVCIIDSEVKREKALKLFEISDVWGIGKGKAAKLEMKGVKTAYDFIRLPEKWVRKNMTIMGERTYKELLGEPCFNIETQPSPKKEICTSRSFGEMISGFAELSEAVANYAESCANKLRDQKAVAASLMVFVHTNHFRSDLQQYSKNIVVKLPIPTADTREIIHYAQMGLKKIFIPGYRYKKAGVIVMDIMDQEYIQMNMFETTDINKSKRLMQVIDDINNKFGHSIQLAVQGTGSAPKWHLRQNNLSQCYTTNINEVLSIKCR